MSYYPPGVTSNEPQITGIYPCAECGRPLAEFGECPECSGCLVLRERENHTGANWSCEDCGYDGGDENICPDGCYELEWEPC